MRTALKTVIRLAAIAALICAVCCPAAAAVRSVPIAHERITRLEIELTVQRDGTIAVHEMIDRLSAGQEIENGVVRCVPLIFRGFDGRPRLAEFSMNKAKVDGHEVPFRIEIDGQNAAIALDDTTRDFRHGPHRFDLTYTLGGQVLAIGDREDLYFDAVGAGWDMPIDRISIRIELPNGSQTENVYAQTATGSEAWQRMANGVITTRKTIDPKDGFAVLCSWPRGLVAENGKTMLDELLDLMWDYRVRVAISFFLVIAFCYFVAWNLIWQDSAKRTAEPTIFPPDGAGPGLAAALYDGEYSSRCATADLIDLAVRGCVTIEDDGTNITLRATDRCHSMAGSLPSELICLIKGLFSSGGASRDTVKVNESNGRIFYLADSELNALITRALAGYTKHSLLFCSILAALFVPYNVCRLMVEIPWISTPILAAVAIATWCSVWYAMMRSVAGIILITLITAADIFILGCDPVLIMGMYASSVGAFILSRTMSQRTREGSVALTDLKGLRLFMTSPDPASLNIPGNPQDTPELFERLLPYAFALECSREWIARFSPLLAESGWRPSWFKTSRRDEDDFASIFATIETEVGSVMQTAARVYGISRPSGRAGKISSLRDLDERLKAEELKAKQTGGE